MRTPGPGIGIIAVCAFRASSFRAASAISNHKAETMVKRQKGLTIIQLMVLLLIAGIAGSVLLKIIIEHRCQSDRSALHCIKQENSAAANAFKWLNRQPA
jgi:Tfp pilus assembly protein PilW